MGWFGPNQAEVWQHLCNEIGADFVAGGFWKGNRVQAHVRAWTITLDTYTVSDGHTHQVFTRMRAPYVNPDGFRFTIYRKGLLSNLGKLLGMQDIEVGEPEFDEAFVIKGNDDYKVQKLCSNKKVRELIEVQPQIRLEVKDSEGWFGPRFPDDVDELYFQVHGVIKDVERLKSLYELFAAVLDQLCRMGSAYEQEPGVTL
jgi:hypothetical protein